LHSRLVSGASVRQDVSRERCLTATLMLKHVILNGVSFGPTYCEGLYEEEGHIRRAQWYAEGRRFIANNMNHVVPCESGQRVRRTILFVRTGGAQALPSSLGFKYRRAENTIAPTRGAVTGFVSPSVR